MKKRYLLVVLLSLILCLEGCSAPDEISSASGSSTALDSVDNEKKASSQDASIVSADVKESHVSSSSEEIFVTEDTAEEFELYDDGRNPGSSEEVRFKYKDSEYLGVHYSIAFISDGKGNYTFIEYDVGVNANILEPEYYKNYLDKYGNNLIDYVSKMSEYEYIGTGDVLGMSSDLKLYLTEDNNILYISPNPIFLDIFSDVVEEILSEYSTDMIFIASYFVRVDE